MIEGKYTLFIRIPIYKNKHNKLFTSDLWAKDLKLHLDYITSFNLCCPIIYSDDASLLESMTNITEYKIDHIYELREDRGLFSVITNFFPNFFKVIKASRQTDIAHSGGAGWAFPLSFYLLICSIFLQFKWIVVIESSFWFKNSDEKFNLRRFINHHVHMWFLPRCLSKADARIFTHRGYKNLLLKNENEAVFINPAIWINEGDIRDIKSYRKSRSSIDEGSSPFNIIFPARLIEDKGIFLVFEAIEILKNANAKFNLSIIGEGPLSNICKEFANQNNGNVSVSFLEPVNYGTEFFSVLRNYDMLLVANLKDEQPRIIYDAFSQGLGVIGPDTDGVKDILEDRLTGLLFEKNNPADLASKIIKAIQDKGLVTKLGESGLLFVKNKNHQSMHTDRERFLKKVL